MPKGRSQRKAKVFVGGIPSFEMLVQNNRQGYQPSYYVHYVDGGNQKNIRHFNVASGTGKVIPVAKHFLKSAKL